MNDKAFAGAGSDPWLSLKRPHRNQSGARFFINGKSGRYTQLPGWCNQGWFGRGHPTRAKPLHAFTGSAKSWRLTGIRNANSGDVTMRKECDCGAEMTGKWADQHTMGCASLEPSPMTADEIVNLIRETYDPIPADWPRHRGWDDGADEIADKILESFGQKKPINPIKLFDKCPLCGLTPERGLHRFCTRGECPVR